MKKFRAAIIGCGGIAGVHEQVLSESGNCEITACVDIIPERAKEMAARNGCPAYTDMQEMLEKEHPDTVHICTPHYLHVQQIKAAAEKGIAVFSEKPPAVNHEQWEELQKLSEKVPIGICFQNRYNPNVEKAEEILRTGTLGPVAGVRSFMTWRRDAGYYSDEWHGKWVTEGGGALINQAIHTLDLTVRFLGKPDTVEAGMQNHHLRGITETEDTVELFLTSGEKRGLLYGSCAYVTDEPVVIDIRTEKGNIRLERDILEIQTAEGKERFVFPEDPKLGKSYWGAGHKRCINDFYRSLAEGKPYRNDVASCENTMSVLLAAYDQNRQKLQEEQTRI